MRRKIAAILFVGLGFASFCHAEDWPQWRGVRRDGTWNATNIIDSFSGETAERVWTANVGSGYSGPTIANGRVFVTDRVVTPKETERIHCFDLKTGNSIWTKEYDCPYGAISYKAGPRASVSVDGESIYSLGSTGQLYCLKSTNGDVIWHRDLDDEYDITRTDDLTRMPIWGISASPLIFEDLIVLHIGGRDGACVVALDKTSGEERWRALDDRAQYSAPILVEQAGKQLVVVWTGDSVAGMDIRSGEVYWRHAMKPKRMPIGIATPLLKDDMLYVTSFYDGSLMLKLDANSTKVSEVWRAVGPSEKNTRALQSIISTPIWIGDHIYGVDSYGELRCLVAKTGERLWEDRTATPRARWSNIHFTRHEDDIWMFNERGEMLIARLTPDGFEEKSRTKLIDPTLEQLRRRQGVCWAHPAFANGYVVVRNDNEMVCVDLKSRR